MFRSVCSDRPQENVYMYSTLQCITVYVTLSMRKYSENALGRYFDLL